MQFDYHVNIVDIHFGKPNYREDLRCIGSKLHITIKYLYEIFGRNSYNHAIS